MWRRPTTLFLIYLSLSLCFFDAPLASAQVNSDSPVTATVPSLSIPGGIDPPTAPILVRPVDGTVTSDPRPEFVWTQSSDQDGNTVYYTLYLDGVATYLGISNLGNSSGGGYTARLEGGSVRLLPTNPLSPGIHTWYIVATDLDSHVRTSATWGFTIDLTPPFLELVSLEGYHLPPLDDNPVFQLTGPRDVHFTLRTEPYASIMLTVVDSHGTSLATHSFTTLTDGLFYPRQPLSAGRYSVLVTALDRANLSSALPVFFLQIEAVSIPLPSLPPSIRPPLDLPAQLTLPPFPLLPSLPASIARVTSRPGLPILSIFLLAVTLLCLLLFLRQKSYNLFLSTPDGQPLPVATVYHSRPPSSHAKITAPSSFYPDDSGRLYIPHLSRLSTLTIRTPSNTLVVSLSRRQKIYRFIV